MPFKLAENVAYKPDQDKAPSQMSVEELRKRSYTHYCQMCGKPFYGRPAEGVRCCRDMRVVRL